MTTLTKWFLIFLTAGMIFGWMGFLYVPVAVVIVMIAWALLSGVRESGVMVVLGVALVIVLYCGIAVSNPDRVGYQPVNWQGDVVVR